MCERGPERVTESRKRTEKLTSEKLERKASKVRQLLCQRKQAHKRAKVEQIKLFEHRGTKPLRLNTFLHR